MAQVLEASVLGALLYLGLGELGQQNLLIPGSQEAEDGA